MAFHFSEERKYIFIFTMQCATFDFNVFYLVFVNSNIHEITLCVARVEQAYWITRKYKDVSGRVMKVTLAWTAHVRYNIKVDNKSVESRTERWCKACITASGGLCTSQSLRFNGRFGESFKREPNSASLPLVNATLHLIKITVNYPFHAFRFVNERVALPFRSEHDKVRRETANYSLVCEKLTRQNVKRQND